MSSLLSLSSRLDLCPGRYSCYVILHGRLICDVTSFLDDHPGGGDLIPEYGGKDVTEIMGDEALHVHSATALRTLLDHLIGVISYVTVEKVEKVEKIVPLQTSQFNRLRLIQNAKKEWLSLIDSVMYTEPSRSKLIHANTDNSDIEDFTKEIDIKADYKAHRFLDLSKPATVLLS